MHDWMPHLLTINLLTEESEKQVKRGLPPIQMTTPAFAICTSCRSGLPAARWSRQTV